MKKIMLLLAMLFTGITFVSAQNEELMKWVNAERQAVQKEKTTKEKAKKEIAEEIDKPNKNLYIALGFGFTSDKYIPLDIYLTYKNVLYGLSVSFPVSTGTKGERYDVVNWDEMKEDHIGEGNYYTPITFDLGYDFKGFTVGIGAGIAIATKYRNCYDKLHILGDNGAYYKEISDGTSGEFKAFIKYRIPSKIGVHCFLSAQYTAKTGIGAVIGFEL